MNNLRAMLLLVPPALSMACDPAKAPCVDGIDGDDTIEVEVIERWDELSSFPFERWRTGEDISASCGELAGVAEGDRRTLRFDGYAFGTSGCFYPSCAEDFPSRSQEHAAFSVPVLDYLCVRSDRKIETSQGCQVHRTIYVNRVDREAHPFATPERGKLPPVIMTQVLSFGSEGLSCADPTAAFPLDAAGEDGFLCADSWVVRLQKR